MITNGGASNLIVKLMLGSAALAMPTMVASAETYSYTTIDVPGSTLTSPSGINDSGAITGYYYGKSSSQYGFIYSGGTYTRLRVDALGMAINDSGEVIGEEGSDSFLYSSGTYTQVKYRGSIFTTAMGINGSGDVAGYYAAGPDDKISGFLYSDGTYTRIYFPGSLRTDVMGIDASGDVAGYYEIRHKDEDIGFIESGGTYTEIKAPGSRDTLVEGVSPSGALYGYYKKSIKGKDLAFVYSGGTFATIDFPGSSSTSITGVNASGVIAGYYTSGSTEFGFVDAGGTYTTIDVAGSTDTVVEGINNSGQVTGYFLSSSGTFGFIATPRAGADILTRSAVAAVPEPSTWAMLLSGFTGLGMIGYGKARSGAYRWLIVAKGRDRRGGKFRSALTVGARERKV